MPSNPPHRYWVRFNHILQAIIVHVLFALIRLLPIAAASAIGGWVGRTFGPLFPVSKMAERNIKRAFPEKTDADIKTIILGMWDNIGRVVFEFPNLDRMRFSGDKPHVEVVNQSIITDIRDDGLPGLFVSGHFANWELAPRSVIPHDLYVHSIYRGFNNPLLHRFLMRRNTGRNIPIPKGAKGAKTTMKLLGKGEHIGMLVDQKLNEGIALPFFGRDAMTAPALAQFALRYDCPVVPFRVERLGGAKFRITYYPPRKVNDTGDRRADVRAFMLEINQMLEEWVRERPEQWLWLHRRWPEN
jgi:Kdo2-lipid IVA lauroyltransferase/acyltransferase